MPNLKNIFASLKPTKQPLSYDEISFAGSNIISQWKSISYNPDDLVGKKGLKIFDKMRNDEACKAGLMIKKLARLSTGWQIISASDDNIDKKIAEFVNYCLTDGMSGSFRNNLKEIYTALDYGYSITEKNYQMFDTGEWRGKIGFLNLKTRLPHDWAFNMDEYGNLTAISQYSLTGNEKLITDFGKFIIFSYEKEFDNFYGRSDLRAAYKHWVVKDWAMKFHSMALERFAMGTRIGKYPRFMQNEKAKIQDLLDSIQAATSITIPDDIQLEILESAGNGIMAYERAISLHNTAIMRSVLVPDLLGYTDRGGSGSYALGKSHFDVFLWVLEELGTSTEESICNEQIIKDLVDKNFPGVTKYPTFKFNAITEDDKMKIAEVYNNGVRDGAMTPTEITENYIRTKLGFPLLEKGEWKLPAPKQNPLFIKTSKKNNVKQAVQNKYTKKVDYKKLNTLWDSLESNTVKQLSEVVSWMKDKLISTVDSRELVKNGDSAGVEKLQLSYVGDFRDRLFNSLATGYLSSKSEALAELRKVGFKGTYTILEEPMAPSEALKYLDNLPVKIKTELSYYKQKAFTIAGIESEAILGKAKLIIYEGIRNGNSKQTISKLKTLFDAYLLTQDAKTGELVSEWRLNTIVRTNMADAINSGRKAMFEDGDVKDDIVGMIPSAVLDQNTTDFCMSIDGIIYTVESFVYSPYHYSCRTIPVPVTKWEIEGDSLENLEDFPVNEIPGF